MNLRTKMLAGIALAVLASAGVTFGAGIYTPGLPSSGAALTGNEQIPADTQLPNGQTPQTEYISTANLAGYVTGQVGSVGFPNMLIGGDFGTNPWQRGTSFTSITNTVTYTADRFFAYGGASGSVSVSQQTGASDITQAYAGSLRLQRAAANADTGAICVAQVLESKDSYRAQGQTVVLAFHALQGANYSGGNLSITVATGTGVDGSSANFATAAWTGYAATTKTQALVTPASWNRYTNITAAIPLTAAQIGVSICYTPVGTAGANDWIELTGVQLEINATGTSRAFARLPAEVVLGLAQRYYYELDEGGVGRLALGQAYTTTVSHFPIQLPVTQRATPTIVATPGTLQVTGAASGGNIAVTSISGFTNGSTPKTVDILTGVASGQTSGWALELIGGNSTSGGKIQVSSEL